MERERRYRIRELLWLIVFLLIVFKLVYGASPNPKRRLALLRGYDKHAIPNYKASPRRFNESLVTVTIPSLSLTHFRIDEEKQTFELEAWPYYEWLDTRLAWQPENNEPVTHRSKIHFDPSEIWLPDILLYNSAQPTNLDVYGKTHCLVTRDGTVMWVPPSKFVSYCDLNLRRWPKDTQVCTVKLGSWTHDSSEIDMHFGKLEGDSEKVKTLEEFKKADMEWVLLDTKAVRESRFYDCCPEPYTSITYEFTIQRRSSLYTYTVFLPALLISFVNLALFLQPADSAGRVTVAAVNFLVVSVYLVFFRTRLPEVDHVPYIVILFGWNLILDALSILIAALVYNMTRLIGSSSPPKFMEPLVSPSVLSILCLQHLEGSEKRSTEIGKGATDDGEARSSRESSSGTKMSDWGLLAATLDRIAFVVFSTITLILLVCFC